MTGPGAGSALNADRRERELATLEDGPVDVLVVGGGVTGAGVALDAASRGLSVILAERHDLAFGTSRWSSKLVHGGLRYLASGAVGIAHESAVERGILMTRTAPHLVSAMPQVVPLLPSVSRGRAGLIRAGFLAGDALRAAARTPRSSLPRSRRISEAEVLRLAPTVSVAGLRGGLLAWDGQLVDDARLVVALARTAASFGARVLTRCAASEVGGSGAVLTDGLGSGEYRVRARMVVNATGVWAGEVAGDVRLRPSRGTHLVLSDAVFGGLRCGLTVPVPGSASRFVFALPAPEGRVYVGLTDEEAPGPVPDVPQPTEAEIDFLLETVSAALAAPVRRADVRGAFAGLRPLLRAGGSTADLSRRHAVLTRGDGLVTVVGGKLTTYRRMAQDALDAALAVSGVPAGPCRTARLPLVGAGPVPAGVPARLARRYGAEAGVVAACGSGDPVAPGVETTEAELRFAVTHEGALDVGDLLDRRCRVGLVAQDRAAALPAAQSVL
ncbi:MAG: glycerol-3-phosphate dehydrogenase/oxidase [Jatrophihabitans sp.]|nr:MAG: glycerol-3-phosphate dehydrogenase/oxidase [Jatrophihabitans sp.]